MSNTNNKLFQLRPMSQLMAIVRGDLRVYDQQGLINDGTIIKVVKGCNDRLGIPIREIKQACISIDNFEGELPINFEKLYFACALKATNTSVHTLLNAFDNNFDQDILYDVDIDRGKIGRQENVNIVIKRKTQVTTHHQHTWVPLSIHPSSLGMCHISCPNTKNNGKYHIQIMDDKIITPFRCGEIYIMYLGTMQDEEGNILFPFHSLITPYYEWAIKEKIMTDILFNSDDDFKKTSELLALSKTERAKAWIDAFNITMERGYGEWADAERKKELQYYNKYYKYLS